MNRLYKNTFVVLLLALGLLQPDFKTFAAEYSAATSPNRNKGTKTQVIVADIMDVVGLKANFEVRTSNDIDNAAAIIFEGKRYIVYNKDFVTVVNKLVQTEWAAVSVLAHEIGHHLNGHTLVGGGSVPGEELESDEFSGFVLRRMGASLEEAQAGIQVFGEEKGSATHPAKSTRLQAIAKGWHSADQQILASVAAVRSPGNTVARQKEAAGKTEVARPASGSDENLKAFVLSEVFLASAPQNSYYITENLNFVRADTDGWHVIGKLKKSDLPAYEYMLHDNRSSRLFIARNGVIVDKNGKPVGYLR